MTAPAHTLEPIAPWRAKLVVTARLLPFLAAALVLAVGSVAIDGEGVGIMRDDSMYVVLAKSLATGRGFHWIHVPGAPAATHFPPGYPAVLALLWRLFPTFPANVIVFKLVNVLFSACAAFGLARLARARFGASERTAQAFALVAMIGVPTLTLTLLVMSEPLFLALVVAALLVAERVGDERGTRLHELIALGLLAGAATLVRTHGIALVAAIPIALGGQRRFRDAAVVALSALVLLAPWQLWIATQSGVVPPAMRGNYESYGGWLAPAFHDQGLPFLWHTAGRTTSELAVIFQHVVAPAMPASIRILGLVALVALVVAGIPTAVKRAPMIALFLALSWTLIIFIPYSPGRYAWSLWPVMLFVPALGVRRLIEWRPTARAARWARFATLGMAALITLGYGAYNVRGYVSRSWSTRWYGSYLHPLLVWVASHTTHDVVLASEAEGTVYLYTGRQTVPVGSAMANDYFRSRTPREYADVVEQIVERYHPDAVIVRATFLRAAARELATRQPPILAVVDTFPGGGLVLVPTSR